MTVEYDDLNHFQSSSKSYGSSSDKSYDDLFVEDELDFSSWNPESIPLLKRTIDQARSLGVKRTLSWVAGKHEQDNDIGNSNSSWHWARKLKVFLLTALCVAITVLLLFIPEQRSDSSLISVENGINYQVDIDELYGESRQVDLLEIILRGSTHNFIDERLTSITRNKLWINLIFLENLTIIDTWEIGLVASGLDLDAVELVDDTIENVFNIKEYDLKTQNLTLRFSTDSETPVAFFVALQLLSDKIDAGVIYGAIILVILYICITLELAHRTVIAMLGATSAIAILAALNERPSLKDIMDWVDIETLTLLFSMMVIVSILSETGAFNYLGFWAYKFTNGQVWPLIYVLCTITAVVSAFLDNVTTILLMTPVVIQLCETVNIDTVKVLIATVTFSNIGGAATAIGDPPNVLIASDPGLNEGGITFLNFSLHMTICVIIVALVSAFYLRIALRNITETQEDRELHDLRHEIIVWHKTLRGLGNFSKEEAVVKEIISLKIEELRDDYEEKLAEKNHYLGYNNDTPDLKTLEESNKITNMGLLVKACVVLAFTVILFFLQNIPSLNLSLGWTALLGAITLLILADTAEVESIFSRVEWATLVFFAALFVLMKALDTLGLLEAIGSLVETLILNVQPDYR